MKELLFSYGTLQQAAVQLEIFGRILVGEKDLIVGYKVDSIEIRDKRFLLRGEQSNQQTLVGSKDEHDAVEGRVFKITAEELDLADKYEPEGYKRVEVELVSGKRAWTYIAG